MACALAARSANIFNPTNSMFRLRNSPEKLGTCCPISPTEFCRSATCEAQQDCTVALGETLESCEKLVACALASCGKELAVVGAPLASCEKVFADGEEFAGGAGPLAAFGAGPPAALSFACRAPT